MKLFLFITVISFCGVISANALTISDDGKYTLILTSSDGDVSIDGASEKVIRFNVNEDETTVKLSELTKKIVPFNGKNEFAYWGSFIGEKESEDIAITEFSWSGEVVGGTYTNGLTLYAIFSDKPLQGTGTYYITLDGFAGTINGEKIVKLTSKSTEFKTVDLTKYTPVRKGYTFTGWELDGKFVTSIDSSYFANRDCITLTATYTQDTFSGEGIVLKLNANGGKLNGKEINSYDYIGGENSGTTMSLLPYIPVKEGYTFNGWNTKKDGSGEILKYVYWRFWDKENETDVEIYAVQEENKKEKRKKENSENRKIYLQEYFKTYNRPKKDDNSYEQMIAQQIQDSMELSFSNSNISDYVFVKWNSSAYHTNNKGNLVIDRKLKVGFDVPKSVNMNIKIPTQKYKNRCVYSY